VEVTVDPRIPMLAPDDAKAAAGEAQIQEGFADLSVFRILLHHPKLAGAVHRLLSTLLWGSELDGRLRELIIMRIGWVTGSNYEWTQHWRVATGMGIPEADLLGVRDPDAHPDFSELDRAAIRATDETLRDGAISPETWATLAAALGPQELLELVVAIGNWRLFSSLLRSLEVPLEEGVASWPPDGRVPDDGGAT
jgi:alkylhydroperoxidase family enzyme